MATSEEKLRKILEDIALKENYKLSNINIKAISSGGANYTTDLYLATISEALKPDIHLFAKVANLNDKTREKNEFLANVYAVESMFYRELAVNFERIYNKNQVPAEDRLVIPKFYGDVLTRNEETMVLENLEVKGFKSFDRMKTFNWEYASTAVTQLARFHALGFAIRDENPAEFDKLHATLNNVKGMEEMMGEFMQQGIQMGIAALSDEYKSRVQNFCASTEHLMTLMTQFLHDTTALIHGDFRPSNLMHRRKNGKLEVIPLDFQTIRIGNPVGDLLGFIFSGSDEEFRKFHYNRLLDYYFSQLTLSLKKLRIDVEKVYPRKAFDNDVTEMRPFGLLMSLMMVGVLTVAPEDAPQFDGDLSSIMVKPNQLAQERMSGIAKDFIRWGVI